MVERKIGQRDELSVGCTEDGWRVIPTHAHPDAQTDIRMRAGSDGWTDRQLDEFVAFFIYGRSVQEGLESDACVVRLSDKSAYYFEMGMRIASLTKDEQLETALLDGMHSRWVEMVKQWDSLGVPRPIVSPLNPVGSAFQQTLTNSEQEIWYGGREAEKHFKQWMDHFAAYKMKASQIADPPAKKLKTGP